MVDNTFTARHIRITHSWLNPQQYTITKTSLYKNDPLKPHFYVVKLGFTGVSLLFLFLLKNIDCEYSLEQPHQGISNDTHNLCFEQKYEEYQFLSENFQFLEVKFSIYLKRHVFVIWITHSQLKLYMDNTFTQSAEGLCCRLTESSDIVITKTHLFKYTENTKKGKFSDKNFLIIFIFLLKT